jgi:hypothetical protein
MNDVPPGQPPSDDIDSFYRRASALDPSRPSDRTRQAVLAHARKVAASNIRIDTKLRRRDRWWRPAVFGTLAAAGLAGLLALPQILTPRVAPRTTHATAQLSQPGAGAPASAAPTSQVARPPADRPTMSQLAAPPPAAPPAPDAVPATPAPATPATAKRPATAPLARADDYVAPTRDRDSTDRRETKTNAAQRVDASAGASAGVTSGTKARERPAPPETESITVTGQRRVPNDSVAASPMAAIAPTEPAPTADRAGASEALKARSGSPQALRLAAETGDLKGLQRLLDQLTDINSRDDAGRTALLLATLHGQTEAVEFLLGHGANPNTPDSYGVTPLSAAMAGNHSTIIRMLKGAGAH